MSDPNNVMAELPAHICTRFNALLPDLRECAPHEGKYTLDDLKREGIPAPAVKVSCLGAKQDQTYAGAPATFLLLMAAYVVTRDGLGTRRDLLAAQICQTLLATIPEQTWGLDGIGPARTTAMHTLISTKVKSKAVSLWAVTWLQPISFFQPAPRSLGVELHVGIAPKVGADHADDYEHVGGSDDE
ncbi:MULTISPECIES: hypothetical protein [Phaeobacter]|uniref:hypothetical protein n=1 Tax=Phaeobacter TaxID=302485 RepID=UPI003A89DDF7